MRRQLAQRWGVPPWAVDSVPWYEIANELDFIRIENEVAAWKKQNGR